jgi:hypothetical protein
MEATMKSAAVPESDAEVLNKESHPTHVALPEVIAQVQVDAEDAPESYLADTIVPAGGE